VKVVTSTMISKELGDIEARKCGEFHAILIESNLIQQKKFNI
jgi:hypothetical protein